MPTCTTVSLNMILRYLHNIIQVNPKPGCRFAKRCKYVSEKYSERQQLEEVMPNHFVACCRVREIN